MNINNINNNGISELSHLGFILVSGPQAEIFLNGQLTCDVKSQKLGGYCNIQGRLISLFRLIKLPFEGLEGFCLECPLDILDSTMTTLKKYAVFSKVKIENISDKIYKIGLSGPDLNPNINNNLVLISPIAGMDNINRFEIISADLSAIQAIQSEFSHFTPLDSIAWQALDILAKSPSLTPKTQGEFLPHNINLPALGGISFDKGCYLGQEIIARMHYKSKIKKHLVILNTQDNASYESLEPGDAIYDENTTEPVGHVVNRAGPLILASVLI